MESSNKRCPTCGKVLTRLDASTPLFCISCGLPDKDKDDPKQSEDSPSSSPQEKVPQQAVNYEPDEDSPGSAPESKTPQQAVNKVKIFILTAVIVTLILFFSIALVIFLIFMTLAAPKKSEGKEPVNNESPLGNPTANEPTPASDKMGKTGENEKNTPSPNNELNEKLLLATMNGDTPTVKSLLSQGASINCQVPEKYGFIRDSGFQTNLRKRENTLKGKTGFTPLHFAVDNKDEEIINLLLSQRADLNAKNSLGETPVFLAVLNRANSFLDNTEGPSIRALRARKTLKRELPTLKILDLLIANGAKAETRNKAGTSAFEHAVACLQYYCARNLLKKGAKIDLNTENSQQLIHSLVQATGAQAFSAKCHDKPSGELYYSTYMHKFERMLDLLLSQGVDINSKNKNGQTPLHLAILAHHRKTDMPKDSLPNEKWWLEKDEIVGLLLKKGAKVNIKDNQGKTALDYAKEKKYNDIVNLLNKHQ